MDAAVELNVPTAKGVVTGVDPGGAATSTRRRRWFIAVTLLGTGLLTLIAAELFCRAAFSADPMGRLELTSDPLLFYRLTPGFARTFDGRSVTVNSQGMRSLVDHAVTKKDGATRVAWVGDSVCYGAAVADQDTAAARLQTLAEQGGRQVDSLNFGVPGYNILQAAAVVEQRVGEFEDVDYVVYLHHENDIANFSGFRTMAFTSIQDFWGYDRPGSFVRRVMRRSLLANLLYVKLMFPSGGGGVTEVEAAGSERIPEGITSQQTGTRPMSQHTSICVDFYRQKGRHHELFRRDLGRLVAAARRLGATPIVVYFPSLSLNTTQRKHLIAERLEEICADLGVSILNVSDSYQDVPPAELYFDNGHPAAAGHQLIAAAVLKEIERNR